MNNRIENIQEKPKMSEEKQILEKMRLLREAGNWQIKDKEGKTIGFTNEYLQLHNKVKEFTNRDFNLN